MLVVAIDTCIWVAFCQQAWGPMLTSYGVRSLEQDKPTTVVASSLEFRRNTEISPRTKYGETTSCCARRGVVEKYGKRGTIALLCAPCGPAHDPRRPLEREKPRAPRCFKFSLVSDAHKHGSLIVLVKPPFYTPAPRLVYQSTHTSIPPITRVCLSIAFSR